MPDRARVASVGGTPRIDLEDVDLFLPDGRRHRRDKTSGAGGGRKCRPFGPVRLRQINAVSCDRWYLALWRGPHSQSRGYPHYGSASEALYSDQHAARCCHVSGACLAPIQTTTSAERSSMRISATSSTNSIARKCGHSGCPVASSSVWRWPALCSCGPIGCSSMNRHLPSTRSWRLSSTPHWCGGYRRRRSCPSAIARPSSGFTSATSKCARKAITSRSAIPRRWWRQSDQ